MARDAQGVEPAQRHAIRGTQQAQQAEAQYQQAAGDAHGTALHLRAQAHAQQALNMPLHLLRLKVRLLDKGIVRELKDDQNERTAKQLSEAALIKP